MTLHSHTINALVLRATPGRGRVWILQCFSDQLGRIFLTAIPRKGSSFSPFCLIEVTVTPQGHELAIGHDAEIIDTFAEVRSHKEASKSAYFLRAILEKCLPMQAPDDEMWKLTMSLFHLLTSFQDWKAAPLMLAFSLFEHEGVSPLSMAKLPSLTSEGKSVALKLLEADEAVWRSEQIPDDLFIAALETIGVQEGEEYAKGGT